MFFATVSEPLKFCRESSVIFEQVCESAATADVSAMRAQAKQLLWDTDHAGAEHASTLPHPSKASHKRTDSAACLAEATGTIFSVDAYRGEGAPRANDRASKKASPRRG